MATIIIGGDLVPTTTNYHLFEKGDVHALLGHKLFNLLNDADFRIFNLEAPITKASNPIKKYGPNIKIPPNVVKGLKLLKPDILTLANNHIMDYGKDGLFDTFDILKKNNIGFLGAGKDLCEASKPIFCTLSGKRIGIYACAEHEFSIASENKPGANPFDLLNSLDHISNAKSKCDYLIVLFHGGKEHYQYPTPQLQKHCRKIIDKGGDIVICQHSHTIGAVENYNNGTIVYGQGNFIFDYSDNPYWKTGLLIRIDLDVNFLIDFIPIIKQKNTIRIANHIEKNDILKSFYCRSNEIKDQFFLEEKYKAFVVDNINNYLYSFAGFNKWIIRIDKFILHGLLLKIIYSKNRLLKLLNFIECESHREIILNGLEGKVFNDK